MWGVAWAVFSWGGEDLLEKSSESWVGVSGRPAKARGADILEMRVSKVE